MRSSPCFTLGRFFITYFGNGLVHIQRFLQFRFISHGWRSSWLFKTIKRKKIELKLGGFGFFPFKNVSSYHFVSVVTRQVYTFWKKALLSISKDSLELTLNCVEMIRLINVMSALFKMFTMYSNNYIFCVESKC